MSCKCIIKSGSPYEFCSYGLSDLLGRNLLRGTTAHYLISFYVVRQESYGKPKALPCLLMNGQCLFLDRYENLEAEPVITGRDGHRTAIFFYCSLNAL